MLKTTTTALLRWRVNGFQAATTRNYALENVCIISNHGILEIEMGTLKKNLVFFAKKYMGSMHLCINGDAPSSGIPWDGTLQKLIFKKKPWLNV
jgi:hypothetical protein